MINLYKSLAFRIKKYICKKKCQTFHVGCAYDSAFKKGHSEDTQVFHKFLYLRSLLIFDFNLTLDTFLFILFSGTFGVWNECAKNECFPILLHQKREGAINISIPLISIIV